jgi:AcrR family transcriptional regulator
MGSAVSAARQRHLTRDDWIDAAWEMLGAGSVELVKVDRIARNLRASRGSFYWHFRDRHELIVALFERWLTLLGLATDRGAARRDVEPVTTLTAIVENAIRNINGAQAIALRILAKESPEFQQLVDAEDGRRVQFFYEVFQQIGFPSAIAEVRARLFHALMVSEYLRGGQLPFEQRRQQALAYLEELTRKPNQV